MTFPFFQPMSREQMISMVAWTEVRREGDFVFMRRGTGETGWWHDHKDETDYGSHPMDYDREASKGTGIRKYTCRTCGAKFERADTINTKKRKTK